MTTALTLTADRRPDGAVILSAVGEVDMTNSADLAAATDEALGDVSGRPLIVDLSRVEYLDSAGLSVLLVRAERIEIVASALLGPVLTVCGLTELTTVHGLEPDGGR
ncbi:STAS domain-containing protein [Streptomyces sp. V4-01]|uniref:STAS domain-containing protein n=1 Tax=Actinacidiphila polyblastidii TaxID=3110430 RepID=A0ABU7P591_9ACTN|nr:STAS domain-containing protein [Streptomyces sp. V4-01]